MDGNQSKKALPGQVPSDWYVHGAVAWAENQVLLFAGPEPTEAIGAPAVPTAPPGAGKPQVTRPAPPRL